MSLCGIGIFILICYYLFIKTSIKNTNQQYVLPQYVAYQNYISPQGNISPQEYTPVKVQCIAPQIPRSVSEENIGNYKDNNLHLQVHSF